MLEKQIEDYWNMDGEKELSDARTGSTRNVLLKGRPPEGFPWSGERLTRKQKKPLVVMYGQIFEYICSMQRTRKQNKEWAVEKPKLDNARQIRGIFFIEPNDEEFKIIMEAARRKLEVPMPAVVPCKKTNKEQWRSTPHYWETQDEICLYC